MSGELLAQSAGIKLTQVPYKGQPDAMNDLLSGRVTMMPLTAALAVPHIKAGKLRPLAVTTATRSTALPDLPTVAEAANLAGYEVGTWFGLVAPAKVPEAITKKLAADIAQILTMPDVKAKFDTLGMELAPQSPAQFDAFIAKEAAKVEQGHQAGRHRAAVMASIRTPICAQLGIRHPIFGFSHSVDVAVAIARAGGFPVLGLAREMPHEIPEILAHVEERMGTMPYGIDLMLPSNVPKEARIDGLRAALPAGHVEFVDGLRRRFAVEPPVKPSFFTTQVRSEALFEAQIDAVLSSNARGVATAIGLRADLIERAKARGKLTFSLVGSVRHAQKALAMGVGVLVAQGYDAGGHTGPVGTLSLLPQIITVAGTAPVLAAGGIATGAQVLGTIAMGAQGAWLGTLWMAARENHTPPALLRRLIESTSEDTLITRAHSGKPCRVVRSDWIDAWNEPGAPEPLGMPLQQVLTGDVFASIHEHDNPRLIYEAAGQSVFAIERETTVADQVERLVDDMDAACARLRTMADAATLPEPVHAAA